MSIASLQLHLPSTGEHFEFLESAYSDAGRFRFRWTLEAGFQGPPPHCHPHETEVFHVVEGTLRVWLDGEARDYSAGETAIAEPGVVHRFDNSGPEDVVVEVEMDGPLQENVLIALTRKMDGRQTPTLGEGLRGFVLQIRTGAMSTGWRFIDRPVALLGGVLESAGWIGLERVEGWDQPASEPQRQRSATMP